MSVAFIRHTDWLALSNKAKQLFMQMSMYLTNPKSKHMSLLNSSKETTTYPLRLFCQTIRKRERCLLWETISAHPLNFLTLLHNETFYTHSFRHAHLFYFLLFSVIFLCVRINTTQYIRHNNSYRKFCLFVTSRRTTFNPAIFSACRFLQSQHLQHRRNRQK
ncbi:hypothetical protein BDF20DRAFT_398340 [Mycotypha africana]|uniref:uncharacterized protein n=1 Tax=Mycotypha africana TaxID=64632 RepID=UPI002300454B|nr:uncharacterized protein BDF20DRAFT_398340 [Mycotypha africana]KAI8984598.1 hypothetical protein BDF20DRAFT_398340 [Mycotypha africana]